MEWIIVFFVGYIILKAISKDESSHHHSLITKTKQDLEVEFEPNNEIKNKKITNSNKISSKPKKINKNSISRVKITNNQKSVEQSLKTWRKEKSKELAIPCFSILHNSTLKAIVEYLPINKQQLNSVRGVGSKTLDNYGDEILAVLNSKDKDCNQNIDNFNKNITKINSHIFELTRKPNWKNYQKILSQNYITTLYHFTDRSNINSIRKNGGLYSWFYMENNGIHIPMPGGDDFSKQLDRRNGLQDYVRLSFTTHHPMMYIAKKDHRIKDPRILKIDPHVVYWDSTKFSDLNATDNNAKVGKNISNFKNINFTIAKQNRFIEDESERKMVQAEVLVKTHIPIEFITF